MTLKKFISEFMGSSICACDHGCNQFVLKNAAKAAMIMEGEYDAEKIVQIDPALIWRFCSKKDAVYTEGRPVYTKEEMQAEFDKMFDESKKESK